VSTLPHLSRTTPGGDPDSRRNALYLSVLGLSVLLLAVIVVAATTLTGPGAATTAERSRAQQLAKLPSHWKVHTGDSYGSIALKTGLTVEELERFNPNVNPGAIVPGQRLKLRLKVPAATSRRLGPLVHTVRAGETFESIAAKTRHSAIRLQQLNPKLDAGTLQPGDRVRLRPRR
jgi:LysM repeat protein